MAIITQDTQTRIGVFSVRNRLLAVVILAVIVPVAITQYVGVATSRSALEKNIDETLYNAATSAAQSTAQLMGAQLNLLVLLANDPALQLAAVQHNATYSGSAQEDLQTLETRDTEWTAAVAAGNTDLPLIQAVVTGPMSVRLRRFDQQFPAHVEVFMTDAHGAVVAASEPTSDYNQADEAWWQKAWNDGKGTNFVGNEVTYDESSKTYSVNMAVPLATADGKVVGVVRSTYNIAALQANIGSIKFGKTGHTVLVNNQGQVLVSPTSHATAVAKTLAGLVPLLTQPQSPTDGQLDVTPDENGIRSVVSLAPVGTGGAFPAIDQLGWSVAAFQGESEALAPVTSAVNAVLVAVVAVLVLGVFAAYGLSRTLTVPLRRLAEAAQRLVQTSDWSIRLPVSGHSEFTVLAQTFNALTTDLEKLIGTLEARVQARTRDLQLATQVSRQISTILDPAELLPQVVELTKERFGLYHAHIYLVDGTGHRLALAAGAGEAGRRMMEQGHRIAIRAERSLVARAARDNHAIVVDDVTQDPNFLENPLLPNTRSEAALPLSVGNRVLGVLDVQSEQTGRFDADILPVLSTLAGQIAIAVQNARQFEHVQSSQRLLQTIIDTTPDWIFTKDQEYRYMLVNRAFAEYYGKRTPEEMVGKDDYDLGTPVELIEGDPERGIVGFRTDDRAVVEGGEAIHNPYDVVNYADGTLHIFDTSKLPLRDAEGNIIGVLGVSHDVTERLKAEERASQRAAEMQTVAEVGAEVASLLDSEQLLWNVANLTKERFGLYHAHIYLMDDAGENLELTAGAGEVGRMMVATGFTIPTANQRSVVARAARGRQAVIVNNVLRVLDFLPNPMLPATKSEMAVPMIVGDQVIGVLDVQADQADRFGEEETRLMTILAAQIAVAVQNARQFEQTQSSQRLLRLLIDNLPDHIYVKDRQGRFTIRNRAGALHMGAASVEEVIGKTDFDYYPRELAEQYYAAEQAIIQSGEPLIDHEEPIEDAQGRRGWILTTKMPLRNRQGEIVGLVGIGHDITGLKRAEQELLEREQLLRTLIDSMPDLVYVKDTESRYIVSNMAHAQFMGFASPDEAVGKTVFDVYPPDLAPQYYADDRLVIETGQPVEREEINTDSVGNRRWSWVTKVPLRDSLGRVVGLVGIARDITERRRSEETIRRYAAEMETVAEVGTEAATSLDPNRLLESVSTLTKERFGLYHAHIYLMDDAGKNLVLSAGAGQAGQVMVSAGHRIVVSHAHSLVARAARTRQSVIVNNVTQTPDFLPNPLLPATKSEMAVPMIVGDRVIGVLDVQSDQVDRFGEEDMRLMTILAAQIAVSVQNAELYAEQVEVADRLREVDRLKSEFLASMSHELRTPLNSIIGYAEVLLDGIDGELSDDMTEDIGAIHGSGKHLLNLINDILDLAKIEAGQMDLVTENVSLRPLAEDMINSSRVLLKDKAVDLVLDLADDLPDLNADSLRLRQIINNLLTNAIKFTEEGSIALRASVYDADPRMVVISIADTGIGIKEEHLPVIFDRFRQVDQSHTRRASGTGLGLSITRQLVEMHGGRIWAESEAGIGSTFSFTIPVAVEESIKA
jgi:PAS domain S-box-containing protein